MKANRGQVEQALTGNDSTIIATLLYGPDEAGSEALAARLAKAMGTDAERIDLDGATLKADPARLADEAHAFSMFAAKRWVRVRCGDEGAAALEALLESPAGGAPVVIIAGNLSKTSALLKHALNHPSVPTFISYLPEAADAGRIVAELCREAGLRVDAPCARRIAAAASNDRAIIAQEVEKYALYLDAAPEQQKELTADVLDALSATYEEGDIGRLVNAVMNGESTTLLHALVPLKSESVRILNQLMARVLLLARLRSAVDEGARPAQVIESHGRAIFWKEKPIVGLQLQRWTSARLATAHARLLATRRAVMASSQLADLHLQSELIAIARVAARLK